MKRYAMIVEYFGTYYAGSQIQPDVNTVQAELLKAIAVLIKSEIKLVFSGRTDAGVHSKGQVVHFDTDELQDEEKFIYSLNSLLPADISISKLVEVDSEFHSQRSAKLRWYRYTINNKPQRSIWNPNTLHIRQPLNIEDMNKALTYILGEHDFSSFKNTNTLNPAKICNLQNAECKSQDGIISIDLVANRFLYNMVRIIVGTLIEIGKGKKEPQFMKEILDYKDRSKAGPAIKPDGLSLMAVTYESKYNLDNKKEAKYNEDIFCEAS